MKKSLQLNQGDIHIWVSNPQSIQPAEALQLYKPLLTPKELTRQQRYQFAKDQHDALITRALIRTVLSHYANISPQDWRFILGEKDKPAIEKPPLPLTFNISHTKGLIVCAVTLEHDIGIDVEYLERQSDILNIADRYFSSSETKELFSLPSDQQNSRFFDYWTLKESYIKAWGLGLSIPLDDFSFHIGCSPCTYTNSNIKLSFAPHRIDHPNIWHSWLFYPNDTHRMALSLRSEQALHWNISFYRSIPLIKTQPLESPLNID